MRLLNFSQIHTQVDHVMYVIATHRFWWPPKILCALLSRSSIRPYPPQKDIRKAAENSYA